MALSTLFAAPDWRDAATARVKLHSARLSLLAEKYHEISNYYSVWQWEKLQLDTALSGLAAGIEPTSKSQLRLEAVVSKIDESAQPYWLYVPEKKVESPGLVVYLHGYNPAYDILIAPTPSDALLEIAEKCGAYVVVPFARGNNDYQHIGEVNVLEVLDDVLARNPVDRDKIVLYGASMGGLGCWCLGARNAHLFNAIVIAAGRGDFYVWHKLKPDEIPSWHREIIDTQFATRYLQNLTNTCIVALHGLQDDIVTYEQGAYPVECLEKLGSKKVRLVSFMQQGHEVCTNALTDAQAVNLITRGLTAKLDHADKRAVSPRFPGEAGSRAMNALLEPFMLVAGGNSSGECYDCDMFKDRIHEWELFAHGTPPSKSESRLLRADVTKYNLIFFGEPEESPIIAYILRSAGVVIRRHSFVYAGKTLKRSPDHGFLIALPSPFDKKRTVIVQCGLPWAKGQDSNHRFDRIPDVISYTSEDDMFGYPVAEAAGFINDDGTVRWSPNPFTESIKKIEEPEYDFSPYYGYDDRSTEGRGSYRDKSPLDVDDTPSRAISTKPPQNNMEEEASDDSN